MDRLIINLFIMRGDYLIKYILIGIFVLIVCIVIFALLKVASDFDDEAEELYNDFYDDDGLDEDYDYYENRYKEIVEGNKSIQEENEGL